jgi:hypothetical protein
MMKLINWKKSEQLMKMVDARSGECLANVVRSFLLFPDTLPQDAVCVEGIWKIGGQLYLHTWIETDDTIIDPTLSLPENRNYWIDTEHYKIRQFNKEELKHRFWNQFLGPGVQLEMTINWNDQKVEQIRHEIDPP